MDQALASNPIFSVGTKAARARLLEEAELRTYAAGAMVLSEGEAATQLWVLLSGAVRVYHATPEGEEVVIKLFRPPAIFGEAESLSGVPFLENVRATEPSTALVLPIVAVVRFLDETPRAGVLMLADVARRLAIAAYDEKSLAFHPVTVRLANHLLDHLAGSALPDATAPLLAINQDEMATAIGATRRSVAKDVIAWQKEGILSKEGGGYRVRDIAGLRRYADAQRLALSHRIEPLVLGGVPIWPVGK